MKKYFLLIICGILLLSGVLADTQIQSLGTFPQNQGISLIQTCTDSTYSNISRVVYPNSSYVINSDVVMTKNGDNYNYSYNMTSTVGNYLVYGHCDEEGSKINWVYDFTINPSGVPPSVSRTDATSRSIYIIFAIGVLLFIGFMFMNTSTPIKYSFLGFSLMFFLIAVNLLFVSIQDEIINPKLENFLDFFSAAFWYAFYFIAFLLILMWFFTFIQTWLLKKNQENMRRFGLMTE